MMEIFIWPFTFSNYYKWFILIVFLIFIKVYMVLRLMKGEIDVELILNDYLSVQFAFLHRLSKYGLSN